jgi:hypothetical protein
MVRGALRGAVRVLALGAALVGGMADGRAQGFVGQAQVWPVTRLYALCAKGDARACDVAVWLAWNTCFDGYADGCLLLQRLASVMEGNQRPAARTEDRAR